MKVEGYLIPPKGKDKYWGVEIPLLGIHTQGKNKKDAYAMAKDALHILMEDFGTVGVIKVKPTGENTFWICAEPMRVFLTFIFSRIRTEREMTLDQVAKKLSSKSANTYARYEQGKAMPKLDQFERLVQAIDPDIDVVIRGRAPSGW